MLIEQRKSFQIAVFTFSICLSILCWLIVRPYVPKTDTLAQCAFALLLLAAIMGFISTFKLIFALLLTKMWPQLDAPVDKHISKADQSI